MASLLLAHPLFLAKNPDEQAASSPYFPLGLLYLAAYVREHGHSVAIFDGTFCDDESSFLDSLREHTPDLVGISALQPTKEMALTLAEIAAEHDVTVVVGGPDPTLDPTSYLASSAVDIAVHHEGEQTITQLLNLIDANCLNIASLKIEPGVAFRSDGRVIVNAPRPPIENLDELPLPARDLIDMDRYLDQWEADNGYSSMTISTSRGCPYGCAWCRDSVHGDDYRQRSPESVAAEVKSIANRYDVDRLRMVDDVDGIDPEWFTKWADASTSNGAAIPFEPLNQIKATDLPLLDVRDSL